MTRIKYVLISLLIFIASYIYFAMNGAIAHNDTVSYIGFANEIRNGFFPHSPLYQPGVGFFIALVKFFTGLDFFNSFRVLNFVYGVGIIIILNRVFVSLQNKRLTNLLLILLISVSPFIALFSNYLYADIGFVFFTLFSLYILSRYVEKGKIYLLLFSSLLVAISIFTKYNGLSVLLTGILFLCFIGIRNKSIFKAVKEITVFIILPLSYITFWKLYNGSLGGVEFDSYMRVVNAECMLQYLKINIVSLYHLFLDTMFYSAHAKLNHYLLMLPFLGLVITFLFVYKKQSHAYIKRIKNNNVILIYSLLSIIYILSMIGILSLNCLTEISIRMFLTPLVVLYSILIHYLVFVHKESKTIWRKSTIVIVLIYTLFFSLFYITEFKKKHEPFMVSKSNNKYAKSILAVDAVSNIGNSYATPGFRREFYLLGENLNDLKVFPYQSFYDYDHKVEYTNSEYYQLIKEKIALLEQNAVLVVEFKSDFLKVYSDSLKILGPRINENNIYVFD